MPSFPRPGSVTICEINRDLIVADNLSDDRAKETYGKILGMVFSPVQFQADQLLEQSLAKFLPEVDLHGVSWHQHKHILAFVSGPHQTGKETCILANDSQRHVKVIEWRPNGGKTVACGMQGATWDPDGHMILISFSESPTLGCIHFASKPPSLDAHLLPLELPEIPSLTGSQKIEKIAWDPSGERLAISYKGGDELYEGLIAVYDARRTPLVSVSLVGFIRGPGDNPKPLAFSFHNKFKEGPLLSVCWSSGVCCTYPLIFRSHMLP
ncbi:unnamed protein product [Rhodiola kirilowii]